MSTHSDKTLIPLRCSRSQVAPLGAPAHTPRGSAGRSASNLRALRALGVDHSACSASSALLKTSYLVLVVVVFACAFFTHLSIQFTISATVSRIDSRAA